MSFRHDNETRTCEYPSKPVLILMGNTRVDRVWVWVQRLPNFLNQGWGRGQGCHHSSHIHSRINYFLNQIFNIIFLQKKNTYLNRGREYPIPDGDMLRSRGQGLGRQYPSPPRCHV